MHAPIVLACALAACGVPDRRAPAGDDDAPADDARVPDAPADPNVFDPAVTSVVVEIDYETGQEPFTGPTLGFGDTFDLAVANLDREFAGTKPVTIPRTLAEMSQIGVIADEELDVHDLTMLAHQHRDIRDTASRKTYYVVFLSGRYADENGPNPAVLGISIGTTGVVAIFKDAVRSTNLAQVPNVVRFVEQSTLVHELGHAIGLVDNGVAMTSAHEDPQHATHCSNPNCVMYFSNEGASDMARYATDHVLTGSSVLFGAECLADLDALTGGP